MLATVLLPAQACGLAVLIIYGIPLLARLMPSNVRLYPNFITVAQGMHYARTWPLAAVANYRFEKAAGEHWILHLSDVFGIAGIVAIPTDNLKSQAEQVLATANAPVDGMPVEAIAFRRERIEHFLLKAKHRRDTVRKLAKSDAVSYYLLFAGNFSLLLCLMYLRARHVVSDTLESIFGLALIVLFFSFIIWMEIRTKDKLKRIAPETLVACPHCHKQMTLTSSINDLPAYSRTLSCYYCGASLLTD